MCSVFIILVGWSIGGTLTAPGTDPVPARLAEWARDHYLGGVVTYLEQQQYAQNQPKIGGVPTGGIPDAAGAETVPGTGGPGLPAPAGIPDLAGGDPLPGEGQWQTVATVGGHPAVRVAAVRPDAQHTSYVAGVLWIDPTFVRGQLRPGYQDPGGSWPIPTSLTGTEQKNVVAAFNAGFRLPNDGSHGGFFAAGRTVYPLQTGAASLVLNNNGIATVGAWNSEVRMTPSVASVRQNLVMLVDNGKVNPDCASGGTAEWGATVGNVAYIDRSGFGITADGAEVYVGGPALSVCTLGNILKAAGVVRGMEMDINPDWISGVYFHNTPAGAQGFRLYPTQKVPPNHYLAPSSRDWYAWFARP
ncbi:MAG TPA: phosphodiester glycosidase family protein [Amycolatopsis sp.]|nr:phosphodiester glycosidase family protein [Amycolatopsis sp.]